VNKAELIEALSSHYDGNKAEASRALNAVVQTITYSTASGEKVSITGFGVFEKVPRAARMVRNPRTGERKRAKATAVPRFRAGSDLKAYVSGAKKVPKATAKKAASTATPAKATASATKSTPAKASKSSARSTTTKAPAKSTATKSAPAKKTTTTKKAPAAKTAARTAAKTTARTPAKKTPAAKTTAAKIPARTAAKKATAKRTAKKS
jgi:DNA-binding protein HU-beta